MFRIMIRNVKGFKPIRSFTTISGTLSNPATNAILDAASGPTNSTIEPTSAPIVSTGESGKSQKEKEFVRLCFQHTKIGLKDSKTFEEAVRLATTRLFYLNAFSYIMLLQYFAFCRAGVSEIGSKLELSQELLRSMMAKVTHQPSFLYLFTPFQLAKLVTTAHQLQVQDPKFYEAVATRILEEPIFLFKFSPSEIAIMLQGFYNSKNLNKPLINLIVDRIEKDPPFFQELKSGSITLVLKCASKAYVDCRNFVDMVVERLTCDVDFFRSFGPKYLTTILLNIHSHPKTDDIYKSAAERIFQEENFRNSFDPLDSSLILILFAKKSQGNYSPAFEAMADRLLNNNAEVILTYQPKQLCALLFAFGKAQETSHVKFFDKIFSILALNPGRLKKCDVQDLANLVYGLKSLNIQNETLEVSIRKLIDQNPSIIDAIPTVTNVDARDALLEYCNESSGY